MFENLLRTLKQLEGRHELKFKIAEDKDGYIDRECPFEECEYHFKVHGEDWENLFKDEAVYCPMCRHEAPSDEWFTRQQLKEAENQAKRLITSKIDRALLSDARSFNARQNRNSFLKMSLSVTGARPHFIQMPLRAMEEMLLKISCESCGSRYGVIGSAFFCPCCGHNSVEKTLDDSLTKVEVKIGKIDSIRRALSEEGMKDEAEVTVRSLIETSLSDCVVAFQRYAEHVYKRQPNAGTVPFNAFQRLDDGGRLWGDLLGEGYSDWLTSAELEKLNLYFQRRHLLSHTEGIVDEKYLNRSGDTTYRLGQRIVVNRSDVSEILTLTRKLVDKIRSNTV